MAQKYTAEIQQLEALLNAATSGVTTDGLRTDFDLEQARRRLNELRALQTGDRRLVRPRMLGIRLNNAW